MLLSNPKPETRISLQFTGPLAAVSRKLRRSSTMVYTMRQQQVRIPDKKYIP